MNVAANPIICKLSNRINLNLIYFGHATVSTSWKGEVQSPVYSRLYYAASGEAEVTTSNGEKTVLKKGFWYLLPAGCSFSYRCEKELEHYYFHLKLCDYDATDLLRKCEKPLCTDKHQTEFNFIKGCIDSNDALCALYLKQSALSVLLTFLKEGNVDIKTENYSNFVMAAIKYIKDNLSVKLTVSEISDKVFVSKSTLTKHFKKELGMSVNEYIYSLIMSKAENLLTTTDDSIQSISEKFGFYDQFYFSKRFCEKFGQPPKHYRKNKLW